MYEFILPNVVQGSTSTRPSRSDPPCNKYIFVSDMKHLMKKSINKNSLAILLTFFVGSYQNYFWLPHNIGLIVIYSCSEPILNSKFIFRVRLGVSMYP